MNGKQEVNVEEVLFFVVLVLIVVGRSRFVVILVLRLVPQSL
jgi:hypothetical protein